MTFVNITAAGTVAYPQIQLEWAPTTQPTAGTQTYVDITTRLREWAWSEGRNDELGEFDPGSGYVLLDNRDRQFDPSNTGGTWYGNIKPRRAFRLQARPGDGQDYVIFLAYSRGYPQAWPAQGKDAVVRVDLVGRMAFLESFDLPVGFTRPAELSGARINAVLDEIGFPTGGSERNIDTGTVTVAALEVTDAGQSALAHCRDVAKAEFGQFFGRLGSQMVFDDRHARLTSPAGTFVPDWTFLDTSGGHARYDTTLEPQYDDTYLWNDIRVDGPDTDATPGTATGGTSSVADYWSLSKSLSTVLDTEPDRTALAQYYAYRYAQPTLRVPTANFSMGGQAGTTERAALLSQWAGLPVVVKRFNSGSTVMSLTQYVEGVSHSCKPGGPWTVGIATSPADTTDYWTLEAATLGTIDTTNLIAP